MRYSYGEIVPFKSQPTLPTDIPGPIKQNVAEYVQMWVIAIYENEKFLGNVIKKSQTKYTSDV